MKFGWKTISGGLLWALGQLSSPEVMSILPEKASTVVSIIGGLLGVIGIRHAVAKR